MEEYYQSINIADWFSMGIFFIDKILFLLYLIAVCYIFIFAIASLIRKSNKYPPARKQFRYAIFFFIDYRDSIILESIKSFQYQLYPSDKYDIIVVSNERHKDTNILLEQLPVKIIITDKINYNKARALQYAIAHTPDKIYDTAIIMDADNNVDNTFLKEINDALYSGGMAIQTHRVSRKLHTDTALFAAISEEINNSIFRLGHVNIGFSSALIGSGMALNFSWLKKNLASITMNDVVKELETMLLEQSIYIEYLNNTHVYGEKAPKADQYYQQRTSWYFNPVKQFISSFIKIPKAIIQGNYDLFDKLFQWLIPSRTLLIGTLVLISIGLIIFSWGLAIKWVVLLIFLIVAFSIATPDYFIDARFIKAMRSAPLLFTLTALNTVKRKIKS